MKRDFVPLSLLLVVSANSGFAVEANCAGADLSKLASAVYVSPQGTDGSNCGQNTGSACKTIQQGITNCRGETCGVLVRYGVYNMTAPVQLADGVSLYGSCIYDETPYRYRSMIVGRPAVRGDNIKKPTTLYGFVILGSSPGNAGEASVALLLTNSTGLTLSHDVVASGKGGNGNTGTTTNGGIGGTGGYASGNSGGAGGRACPASPPAGSTGEGGRGADFQQLHSSGCFLTCKCENNNYPASLGKNGGDSDGVLGGAGGQRGSAGCACGFVGDAGNGPGGDSGRPGKCGATGGVRNPDTKGTFSGTTWIANRGGSGTPGQVGSGGGGGGSGGFGVVFPPTEDFAGYPGGGGGGGGCGGPGGQGGQQGAASIPLVLANSSTITIDATNAMIPGPGGAGGAGGAGGRGGTGGAGINGKTGTQWRIGKAACSGTVPGFGGKGGNGGQGGAGGGGAGGNGGPSFAIALVNSQPPSIAGLSIYAAQPGAGAAPGQGGQNDSSQCKGGNGQEGVPGYSNNQNSVVSYTTAEAATSSQ